MVNFTRCFDLAWERMVTILFRPFSLGKWFAIGLSAFLAGLLAGGNGFNFNFNHNFNQGFHPNFSYSYNSNVQQFHAGLDSLTKLMQGGLALFVIVVFVAFFLALILLFYWLGSRGQFLLLDNVVRNRAAIRWPWQVYARQANSLFGFMLLIFLVGLALVIPLAIAAFLTALPLIHAHRSANSTEIGIFICLGLAYLGCVFCFYIALFLFRELGVPLMFRHGLLARSAAAETWALVRTHTGVICGFVALRLALFVALTILSVITCCCCIGAIPYLGTVVLLPALIYIKCFTLEFLSQLGPRYDVWSVDVPPDPIPTPTPSIIPPQPPG